MPAQALALAATLLSFAPMTQSRESTTTMRRQRVSEVLTNDHHWHRLLAVK
jgi:hypothetical protein